MGCTCHYWGTVEGRLELGAKRRGLVLALFLSKKERGTYTGS